MVVTGCCRGDNPNQDDSLWQLRDPSSGAAEARTASFGHRQQLRTDLTLRPLRDALKACRYGRSGVEHRVNQCSAEAGHEPNGSPAGQMNVSTPLRHLCGHNITQTLALADRANADSRRLWRSALLGLAMYESSHF